MPKILYTQVIQEEPHELEKLEKHHRYPHLFQRVRMLRLLKSGECSNLGEAADVDLRRFRGLFRTENGTRKGEQCHEQTRPIHPSFAEKLSGFLEPQTRSIPSPASPGRSASPMAPS